VTRRLWLAILLLVAIGGGLWWWSARPPAAPAWQGYVEADFIKVGPTQQGLLTAVFVERGDAVAAGAPLFEQDDAADLAARDQSAQLLAQAEEQVKNLQQGGKLTEIAQAEANLADARAVLVRTTTDLARGQALLPTGVASRQTVDQMQADFQSARAKVDALQAALEQSRAPLGRDREIEAQRAAAAAARAALDMAAWRLAQRHVVAPAAGRVADVLARPGETVAAGAPVVSLLSPGRIFVRFFVPEPAISTVHLGERVALSCDACPVGLYATISFISPQPEYTPPLIYSESTSAKLVFLLEARPPMDQAAGLNPGQPMQISPPPARTP
jgi:HlyD family secretion protein